MVGSDYSSLHYLKVDFVPLSKWRFNCSSSSGRCRSCCRNCGSKATNLFGSARLLSNSQVRYALRVAVMNGIAGLDPCDYLGQSARETFKHELWDKRGEMLFLADWTATSVICLTWLSWKTGSRTCQAFVTMIISGHNYHISNATISWQWHCVINYVEAVKFIPLFLVKKSVEVSGKWQLHSTWHYVLSRWRKIQASISLSVS